MEKYDILIGIDPDSKKSGVAIYLSLTKEYFIKTVSFFELYEILSTQKESVFNKILVILEAGWLNKSNWHVNKNQSNAVSGLIGNKTGLNHQTGILIEQMCQYLNIEYRLVRPTTQKWTLTTCKNITHVNMKYIPSESKQDCVDALKLIWH